MSGKFYWKTTTRLGSKNISELKNLRAKLHDWKFLKRKLFSLLTQFDHRKQTRRIQICIIARSCRFLMASHLLCPSKEEQSVINTTQLEAAATRHSFDSLINQSKHLEKVRNPQQGSINNLISRRMRKTRLVAFFKIKFYIYFSLYS